MSTSSVRPIHTPGHNLIIKCVVNPVHNFNSNPHDQLKARFLAYAHPPFLLRCFPKAIQLGLAIAHGGAIKGIAYHTYPKPHMPRAMSSQGRADVLIRQDRGRGYMCCHCTLSVGRHSGTISLRYLTFGSPQ